VPGVSLVVLSVVIDVMVAHSQGFYDGYTDVARVVSALFIVLQIVIILDYTCTGLSSLIRVHSIADEGDADAARASAMLDGIRDYLLAKMDEADQDDEARQSLLDADYTSQSHSSSRSLWYADPAGSFSHTGASPLIVTF